MWRHTDQSGTNMAQTWNTGILCKFSGVTRVGSETWTQSGNKKWRTQRAEWHKKTVKLHKHGYFHKHKHDPILACLCHKLWKFVCSDTSNAALLQAAHQQGHHPPPQSPKDLEWILAGWLAPPAQRYEIWLTPGTTLAILYYKTDQTKKDPTALYIFLILVQTDGLSTQSVNREYSISLFHNARHPPATLTSEPINSVTMALQPRQPQHHPLPFPWPPPPS